MTSSSSVAIPTSPESPFYILASGDVLAIRFNSETLGVPSVLTCRGRVSNLTFYECRLCPYFTRSPKRALFTKFDDYVDHCEAAHGDVRQRFFCRICLLTFSSSRDFRAHSLRRPDKGFLCKLCNFVSVYTTDMWQHFTADHPDISVIQCAFQKPDDPLVKLHLEQVRGLASHAHPPPHSGRAQDKVPCPVCQKLYKNSGSLKVHVRSAHTRGYTCKSCGTGFKRPEALYDHIRQTNHSTPPGAALEPGKNESSFKIGVCGQHDDAKTTNSLSLQFIARQSEAEDVATHNCSGASTVGESFTGLGSPAMDDKGKRVDSAQGFGEKPHTDNPDCENVAMLGVSKGKYIKLEPLSDYRPDVAEDQTPCPDMSIKKEETDV